MALAIDDRRSEQDRKDGERRRRRASFFLRERRTGFERRASAPLGTLTGHNPLLAEYRGNTAALIVVLLATNVFNATDLVLTFEALGRGAHEGNPLMAWLIAENPFAAIAFKLLVGLLATLVIWRLRKYRAALVASLAVCTAFAVLLAYHVALGWR